MTENEFAELQVVARSQFDVSVTPLLGEDPARWEGADIFGSALVYLLEEMHEHECTDTQMLIAVMVILGTFGDHPMNLRRQQVRALNQEVT